MKNLRESEVQAVSGGFVIEAAAAAFLGQTLANAGYDLGMNMIDATSIPAILEPVVYGAASVAYNMLDLAPFAGVAAYSAWHFSSDETKSEIAAALKF